MKFTTTSYTPDVNFLVNDNFTTRPMKLDFSGGVKEIKSGTVITKDGKPMASGLEADAFGILLNTTTPDDPNASLVYRGDVWEDKLQASVSNSEKAAMPGLFFFANDGTYTFG